LHATIFLFIIVKFPDVFLLNSYADNAIKTMAAKMMVTLRNAKKGYSTIMESV